MHRFRLRTLGWMGANALLLTVVVMEWVAGTHVDEIRGVAAVIAPSERVDFQIPAVAPYPEVLWVRALFHQTRRFYTAPIPVASPVQIAPPNYRLVGLLTWPNKPAAALLVHNLSGTRTKVQKGDRVEGWVVESIDSKQVRLRKDGHAVDITSSAGGGLAGRGLQRTSVNRAPRTPDADKGVRVLSGGAAPR